MMDFLNISISTAQLTIASQNREFSSINDKSNWVIIKDCDHYARRVIVPSSMPIKPSSVSQKIPFVSGLL